MNKFLRRKLKKLVIKFIQMFQYNCRSICFSSRTTVDTSKLEPCDFFWPVDGFNFREILIFECLNTVFVLHFFFTRNIHFKFQIQVKNSQHYSLHCQTFPPPNYIDSKTNGAINSHMFFIMSL